MKVSPSITASILCALGVIASSSCASEPMPKPDEITVTESQQAQSIAAHVGAVIKVRLEAAPGTGYGWQPVAWNQKVLRYEDTVAEGKPAQLGGKSVLEYRFRAIEPGASPVRLEYRRPWEQDKAPARTFAIQVEVTRRTQ